VRAGLDDRIELRLGPAVDTLAALDADVTFDLAFIDADKPSYLGYYEALLPRLRSGGLILVDNTLWGGAVVAAPATDDDANTVALRAFNDHVAADPRVVAVLLTVRDGVTLIRRR
ncbi:MAG: class I SAM-dependent methyltransferase, partial [Mycobacteriales bacterium]